MPRWGLFEIYRGERAARVEDGGCVMWKSRARAGEANSPRGSSTIGEQSGHCKGRYGSVGKGRLISMSY